jgi:hypothetical protein
MPQQSDLTPSVRGGGGLVREVEWISPSERWIYIVLHVLTL